ncbi:MAG TPA: 6,7-dimethyl-8-ribityllumazine synthase [Gaiellaceae bacterium]
MSEQSGEHWPGEQLVETEAEVEVEAPAEEDTGEEQLALEQNEPKPEQLSGHAPGGLDIPDGVDLVEGSPQGTRKRIAIVLSRFNGDVTNRLLASALAELERAGIDQEHVTVMPVPGAFELPLGAMALAKTRRYVAIVALGCVIRGETAHFEYVAGEAASGLQLAALETGVPVAFGVLTTENLEQAMARADKGAEAVRSALEMADLFNQIRASAKASA